MGERPDSRRKISIQKFSSFSEAEAESRRQWRALSAEERWKITWKLSEELYRIAGKYPHEPGLRRIIKRVR